MGSKLVKASGGIKPQYIKRFGMRCIRGPLCGLAKTGMLCVCPTLIQPGVQRELRAEQSKLQRAKDEAIADLEDDKPQQLDVDQVLRYVMDLKDLLPMGSLMQQRAFLRSFIRRIEFMKRQLSVKCTVPLPSVGKEKGVKQEVLSIGSNGGPCCTIGRTFSLTFSLI